MARTFSIHVFYFLILSKVALSQSIYSAQVGIGSAGPTTRGRETIFAEAARSALFRNSVSFPGFDFTQQPSPNAPQDFLSSSNWTFHLNYSVIDVTNTSLTPDNNRPQLVSNIVYDLAFPNHGPLPSQNNTNWTMCGYFLTSPFPSNLTKRFAEETGDCSATLGGDCLTAYREAFLTSPTSQTVDGTSCPSNPFWNDIPECVDQIGRDFEMVSSSLMNWIPGANNSNVRDYDGPYVGLNSTQPIFYQISDNYDLVGPDFHTYLDEFARSTRMTVLTFQPSPEFLSSGYTGAVNRDVRFVCGTADSDLSTSDAADLFVQRTWWLLCGLVTMAIMAL